MSLSYMSRIPRDDSNLSYVSTINRRTNPEQIRRLVLDMRVHVNDPEFQERGLLAFYKYGQHDQNRGVLEKYKVGAAILDAFGTHAHNIRVATSCCAAIKHLGGNLFRFYRSGGGQFVLSSMATFHYDARLQVYALYAIRTLARCPANAFDLVDMGAGQLIGNAMRSYPKNDELQKAGVGAIWCLLGCEENKHRLMKNDLIPCVVHAMRSFPKSAKTQEYGCGALRLFSMNYTTVRLGGAEVVIAALERHAENERVARMALTALWDMAALRSNAEVIINTGGPKAIVNCMQVHSRNPAVLETTCNLIWQVTEWDEFKKPFVQYKIGRVLLNFLKEYLSTSIKMVSNSLILLRKLAVDEASVRDFITHGCTAQLINAGQLLLRREEPTLVSRVLGVLLEFCSIMPEAIMMIQADSVGFVKDVLYLYKATDQNASVREQAQRLQDLFDRF